MRIFNKMKKMLLVAAALFAVNGAFAESKTVNYIQNDKDNLPGAEAVNVSLDAISFGYLGDANGWDVKGNKQNYSGNSYTHYVSGKSNPTVTDGVPTAGSVMGFVPKFDGQIALCMVVNKGKSTFVLEDGIGLSTDIKVNGKWNDGSVADTTIISGGKILRDKVYGTLTFDVKANKQYYVYCTGSKMGYYGFSYTYDDAPAAPAFDFTACNEAIAWANAEKAKLNAEDETEAMVIEEIANAVASLQDMMAKPEEYELTQEDLDLMAGLLKEQIQGYIDMLPALKLQPVADKAMEDGWALYESYPEDIRTDNAGLATALQALRRSVTQENIDAVNAAMITFKAENDANMDAAAGDATEKVYATFEAPTNTNATWNAETNSFTWNTPTYNQIRNIGLPNGDITKYAKLVVDCEIISGTQFRILFYKGSDNKQLFITKSGITEINIVEELQKLGDDYMSYLTECTEICLSGSGDAGEVKINSMYLETAPVVEEPEVPAADSLNVSDVTVLAAGKTYVLGKQYDMYKVKFTAEKDGFLSITPSQKVSSTSLKINGASSTFTKDANGGITKKGMAAGSMFEGTYYCTGTPSAENVYELVVTFEEGTPYSPLAMTLASPADGGEWSGAAQYKSYGTKGVPHYEFSSIISGDVKATVKIGETVYENIKLTVDGYNPKLDITALPDTLNKAIAAGLIKAGETFTLTLSNIVDKEFAANTLADQTFIYTLASTACTGVNPAPNTGRSVMVTDVTFSFDGTVALADTAKFYMVNLANNEVTPLTGEVVEGTSVKVTVPAIEGLLPRLYNIVAEGVTTAEGDKVITYGNEPGKLVASYGTSNGFFKATTSLQNWGQVCNLKGFTATYPGAVMKVDGIATKPIAITKLNMATYEDEEIPGVTLNYTISEENPNVIVFTLSEPITEVGTYSISVPQKHFWAKDTYTEEDAKLSTPKYAYYQAAITLNIDVVEPTATDVTDKLVNPNFDDADANKGWTAGSKNLAFGTSGDAQRLKDGTIFVGNIVEHWESGNWTGDIAQTIKELPAGAYKFTMGAYVNKEGEAYIFANDSLSLPIETAKVGEYTVFAELAEGADLKVGFKNVSGINWICLDNAHLYYYGEGTTVDMALNADWKVILAAVEEAKAAYADPIEVEALDAAVAAAKIGTIQEYLASAKAVNEALAAFKKVNDAEVAWKTLAAALKDATADAPVDATGFIANPSFEAGGTAIDWTTSYTTNSDWGNHKVVVDIANAQDGKNGFETWSPLLSSVDLHQEVRLPAGSYVVSAALRTEFAGQVTNQHVYVKIGEDVDSSAILLAPTATPWNSLEAWQTLSVAFSIEKETLVTIGAASSSDGTNNPESKGWFQIDNFRLSCTGWIDPALAPAVDSLNALIAEVEAFQNTLDVTDGMQASMNESLTTAIADAKAVAEAKESVGAVNAARGTLNSVYVSVIGGIAGAEVIAAEDVYASYQNPSDNAGLKAAIDKVYEIYSYIQTGMGATAYTIKDLADAVEAMKVAKEAFIKENVKPTEPVVKMTYVDYDQPSTAMGEIAAGATARAGYNKISEGSVAFANTGWGENKITYIQVDASCYTGDVVSAKLTVDVSGSSDSKRTTGWGIGYNSSVWSAGMTYETADKTITVMGGEQWTSTKSATTFETKEFDILDAFKGDEDKVVTLVVYETAAAGGYIKNPTVAIEAANAEDITTYTVKYVDEAGADIADVFTANIMIGEKAALTAEDKADKYNADKTKKYIYASCDRDSIVTVADSASNVITATFREALKYNYTVETTDDSGSLMITMGSYTGFEGDKVTAPYYAYVLNEADSTLYESAKNNNEYNQYITLTQDNMKVQVNYTPTTIKNIVYYQEAENVEGLTKITTGNTAIRSSNSASAYAADADVVLTTLAPGKYKIAAVIYDATKALNSEFSFIAGADTVLKAVSSAANWTNCVSEEFTLMANTTLSLAKGGSEMKGVDLFYIQKTGDVELPAKVAYLQAKGDKDDAIYDALVAAGYAVDTLAYADVTLSDEIIESELAGYDVVVLGGSTGSGTNLAKNFNLLLGKVNVLSTKAFWYAKTTPKGTNGGNPGTAAAPSLSLTKAAGYEEHPIYAGIEGNEFAVFNDMGKSTGRYLQSNGSFAEGTPAQATIGANANGTDCIGEAWVDGKGWIIIPVDGLQPTGYLTADGAQLFVNAVEYLIAGGEYEFNAIEGVRVEGSQWPADIYDIQGRMIKKAASSLEGLEKGLYLINGKKYLVK